MPLIAGHWCMPWAIFFANAPAQDRAQDPRQFTIEVRPTQDWHAHPVSVQQPRARGAVVLRAKAVGTSSQIDVLRQQGALKLVFPTLFRDDMEAVLVNTSGGVTGGDLLEVDVTAGADTEVTVTTQAAERLYRAQPDETGRINNHLKIEQGARLNWLPQETILFDQCACARSLKVDLADDARFLMVETLVFGRTAMGEILRGTAFQDRIAIVRAGRPLYLDGVDLFGDVAAQMARTATAGGSCAVSTVVMVGPKAAQHLTPVRALLPDSCGASLIAPDVLVLRLLAVDSFVLRQTLVPVLNLLMNTPLPKSWRL